MKGKITIFFFIFLMSATPLWAKTADKDFRRTQREIVTHETKKKFFGGTTTTTKVEHTIDNKHGVSSISIGPIVGYPLLGLGVRYRHFDNHLRAMGSASFDYSKSLAVDKITPSVDFEANVEYVFGIHIGGKKDTKKLWYLDIGPMAGLGFYMPMDDPKDPSDYYAVFANIGLVASCDLPYSTLPLTCFARGFYRPTIPFVKKHSISPLHRIGVDIGISYHFKNQNGGGIIYKEAKDSKTIKDVKDTNDTKTIKEIDDVKNTKNTKDVKSTKNTKKKKGSK